MNPLYTTHFVALIFVYASIRTALCANGVIHLNAKFYNFIAHANGKEELKRVDRNMDKYQLERAGLRKHKVYHWLVHEYCQSYEVMLPIARALKMKYPDHNVIIMEWPLKSKPINEIMEVVYQNGMNIAYLFYTIHWLLYDGKESNTVRENSHFIGFGFGAVMIKTVGWCLEKCQTFPRWKWDGALANYPDSARKPKLMRRVTLLDMYSRCVYEYDSIWKDNDCNRDYDWKSPALFSNGAFPSLTNKFAEHITAYYTSRATYSDTCPRKYQTGAQPFTFNKGFFINNEGYFQPGCPPEPPFNRNAICEDLKKKPCNHQRVLDIFVESICVPNSFNASRCIKYGPNGCEKAEFVIMGTEKPKRRDAAYYLNTNTMPPFSRPANCYRVPLREKGRQRGTALYCT